MSWQVFRLAFGVVSNIHVGYQKIGNVQRTRLYVPGRNLWGAVTARLVRGAASGEFTVPGIPAHDYAGMGKKVDRELRFTYFYPAGPDGQRLSPRHTENGLRYGVPELTPEQFSWRHLGTYASTALDYTRSAAEEGSLHEVEFLSPHTRADENGPGYPVKLVGELLVADGCQLSWQKALATLQLGGERRYGWGQVVLSEEPAATSTVLDFPAILNHAAPKIVIPANSYLPAHALATEYRDQAGTRHLPLTEQDVSGPLEPLIGREWDRDRGAGQWLSEARICWASGSVAKRDLTLEIGPHGILELASRGA